MKRVEHRDRIRAAGECNQDALAVRDSAIGQGRTDRSLHDMDDINDAAHQILL
jgi:hypothetical protein